jgi:hypothetical protein
VIRAASAISRSCLRSASAAARSRAAHHAISEPHRHEIRVVEFAAPGDADRHQGDGEHADEGDPARAATHGQGEHRQQVEAAH